MPKSPKSPPPNPVKLSNPNAEAALAKERRFNARLHELGGAGILGCYVLYLCAVNDTNGNPRRLFLIGHVDASSFLFAINEGYAGTHALVEAFGPYMGSKFQRMISARIDITPAHYRVVLKEYPDAREA